MKPLFLHGTSIEIEGKAILILGRSGVGKSSLALQLIDRGALLVADDQSLLALEKGVLTVSAPSPLKGLIEVRGVGICRFPYQEKSSLKLCVEIDEEELPERLPSLAFIEYHGVKVPYLRLNKDDPLGAIKVELKVNLKEECYAQ